jgi:membrane protein
MTQTQQSEARQTAQAVPGGDADKPADIPKRGWLQIAKRGWAEAKADQVPLLAAGVAFYAFLALFPALVALVLIYGLVADPAQIASQIGQLTQGMPEDARSLITNQLTMVSSGETRAGLGAVIAIVLALWSASGGVGNLMTAISTAYDEEQKRSFVKKRGLALLLTVGAIIFMIVILGLVAVFPTLLDRIDSGVVRFLLQVARWVLVAAVVSVALAVLYRVAPDRDAPKMRWVSVGAVVATVLWLIASIGFSIFASFGTYAKTYGPVAGIVVTLFWLWITSYAVLLGAEINAEAEQQTIRDTTKGADAPIGQRGAVKADSLPTEGDDAEPKAEPQHEKTK